MALTTTEIGEVIEEIEAALLHGWIQKIYQPAARTFVFEIRVPGHTHRLLVCCRPETARIHILSRSVPNPPSPPAFCQFLRAHFQGARIDAIRKVPNDRIVKWELAAKTGPRTIVFELTGRNSDLLVLNAEGLVIRHLNGDRELIGRPYSLPHKPPSATNEKQPGRFLDQRTAAFPLSAAIEAHYQAKEGLLAADAAKDSRRRVLKKALKKAQHRIEDWREDLSKAGKYETYARYGELLKAGLGSIPKGADRVALTDYFDEAMPEVTIPLDATKSPQGNIDNYFRKHRKYVAAQRELRPRIEQAEQELGQLRQELKTIEQGDWIPPARSIPQAPSSKNSRKAKDSAKPRRGPFRRFISTDGLPIYVGRNARENEELTFRFAKSDDLWLHARGTPGSHVVVRLEKGKDAPSETLRDGAALALLYSDLKKSGKGEVIYTRRKWVKKAKGQAPGAVHVTQEQSLYVSLDKNRLAALKAHRKSET